MHQLTKDPANKLFLIEETSSSPERGLTTAELSRYLDYCTEMLSLIGKVAALYAQRFDDSVVLGSVNEVEVLTASLSQKDLAETYHSGVTAGDRPVMKATAL